MAKTGRHQFLSKTPTKPGGRSSLSGEDYSEVSCPEISDTRIPTLMCDLISEHPNSSTHFLLLTLAKFSCQSPGSTSEYINGLHNEPKHFYPR